MTEHSLDLSITDWYEDAVGDDWSGFWSNKELGLTNRNVTILEGENG